MGIMVALGCFTDLLSFLSAYRYAVIEADRGVALLASGPWLDPSTSEQLCVNIMQVRKEGMA